MTHEQARLLIERVYAIWAGGTIDQLAEVYDKNVEAIYNGVNCGFSDLEARFSQVGEQHQNPRFKLLDLIVDGFKIAVRSAYSSTLKESGEKIAAESLIIFYINPEGRVDKIWSVSL